MKRLFLLMRSKNLRVKMEWQDSRTQNPKPNVNKTTLQVDQYKPTEY